MEEIFENLRSISLDIDLSKDIPNLINRVEDLHMDRLNIISNELKNLKTSIDIEYKFRDKTTEIIAFQNTIGGLSKAIFNLIKSANDNRNNIENAKALILDYNSEIRELLNYI